MFSAEAGVGMKHEENPRRRRKIKCRSRWMKFVKYYHRKHRSLKGRRLFKAAARAYHRKYRKSRRGRRR